MFEAVLKERFERGQQSRSIHCQRQKSQKLKSILSIDGEEISEIAEQAQPADRYGEQE